MEVKLQKVEKYVLELTGSGEVGVISWGVLTS